MAASRFATFLETFDPDPKTRGTQWEHVCKWFLETDPVYRTQLKKVWLWKKWPNKWGPDAGIDLVAQAKDGTYWAIQAKAYAPDNTVTKQDMNAFLSESARAEIDHRLLIATTRHVSPNATRASKAAEKPVRMLLRHDLDHREGLSWPVSYAAWAKGRIPKTKPKRPYPHQQIALRAVPTQLKTHDRGQLILACGTGKTLTALWLHERLPSSRTLVLVPSLSLLGQTLQEWVGNAKLPFDTLPVCSDDTVRRGEDDALMSSTLDLGYPSTTDPDAVRTFLKRRGEPPRVSERLHVLGGWGLWDDRGSIHQRSGSERCDWCSITSISTIRSGWRFGRWPRRSGALRRRCVTGCAKLRATSDDARV